MLWKLLIGAVPVVAILVASAFLVPPDFPFLLRQIILCAIGVGGILIAERALFGPDGKRIATALGIVRPQLRVVLIALVVSLPMWLFLPFYGWFTGTAVALKSDWLAILLGVVLVNGITEEAIHRAFIFGHLRKQRTFWSAAAISALIFAAQHIYLVFTIGAVAGSASVLLALLLTFPFALLYEEGGNSLGGPAILHTSSNAPIMVLALGDASGAVLLPHMAVVLASMYLGFAFVPWLRGDAATRSVL
jgi:membrane protease YdiL (CAAX protease family)